MPRPQPVCRSLTWAFRAPRRRPRPQPPHPAPLAGAVIGNAAVASAAGADPALLRVADRAAMTITTDALERVDGGWFDLLP